MTVVRSSKGGPARVFDPAQERQKALEQLRTELRHQRAENNALQASRLFREFRLVAEKQTNPPTDRQSLVQSDTRTGTGAASPSDTNKNAHGSFHEARLGEGIWSTAGQPYNCLGQPEEVRIWS